MHGGRRVALIGMVLAASTLSACSLTRQAPHGGATATETSTPIRSAPVQSPSPADTSTTPAAALTLKLGDSVTRDWSPKQGVDGRVRLRVTAVEQADWSYFQGWQVSRDTRRHTRPYFIRASVANVGKADLGGYRVPLYALNDNNQLVEPSTFGSASGNLTFAPCHPDVLPKPFTHGKRARSCLVMLVPTGSPLEGASFRPDQNAQPVTWKATPKRLPPKRHTATS